MTAGIIYIERHLNWKDRYREAAGVPVIIGTFVYADELCAACRDRDGADLCPACDRVVWGDRP